MAAEKRDYLYLPCVCSVPHAGIYVEKFSNDPSDGLFLLVAHQVIPGHEYSFKDLGFFGRLWVALKAVLLKGDYQLYGDVIISRDQTIELTHYLNAVLEETKDKED